MSIEATDRTDATVRVIAGDVGRALAAARTRSGRTRAQLARELGVSDVTLLELEHGRGNPTIGRLVRYAAGYGVELHITTRTARPKRTP